MTNPLPSGTRAYGSLFRTSEVLKVPIQFLLPYPELYPNSHNGLTDDVLCNVCATPGNVKNVDPLNLGNGTTQGAPEVSRSYIWSFTTLQRNLRCSLCRLIWTTFQPFFQKLGETGPPTAVLGKNNRLQSGSSRWIELIAMVYKNTLDNQDMHGSGQVYIYEDERIPHFNVTQRATSSNMKMSKSVDSGWQKSQVVKNDQIDFAMIKRWITVCQCEHGIKCSRPAAVKSPAKRLIDVEKRCIVDGNAAHDYFTLSYVWGMAAQFMLTKAVVGQSTNEGFFEVHNNEIPQSIQDAMQVCRNIGVRHLWVDALCIVQDDDEDKKDQVHLMDEIYGQALAVLVVAAGDDAAYGIPGMAQRQRALASYEETVDGKLLMTSLASTTYSAKRSHWNTRAWTYQEYILGNRLLVFTDTYVFFRCSESLFRDDTVQSLEGPLLSVPIQSDDKWISFTLNDLPETVDPKDVWKQYYDGLLAYYLRRNMKFDSDALPAFSGILKVLSNVLGPFHFGLPKKFFSRSLLWTDPHHGVFERRVEFPSWSWAGWKWTFEYFDAERSTVGAYGYKMPEESVPIQFFTFDQEGRLHPFFFEEREIHPEKSSVPIKTDDLMDWLRFANDQVNSNPELSYEELQMKVLGDLMRKQSLDEAKSTEAEENENLTKLMSHLDPPDNYRISRFGELTERHRRPDQLIAFYTSVATLKVPFTARHDAGVANLSTALEFDVQSRNGDRLFTCYMDHAWRGTQPENLTFVVIGLKNNGKAVASMLMEEVDGIHYRVNWNWGLSQHLSIETWMNQSPVQKLVAWG